MLPAPSKLAPCERRRAVDALFSLRESLNKLQQCRRRPSLSSANSETHLAAVTPQTKSSDILTRTFDRVANQMRGDSAQWKRHSDASRGRDSADTGAKCVAYVKDARARQATDTIELLYCRTSNI